jgi:hypothetical protein
MPSARRQRRAVGKEQVVGEHVRGWQFVVGIGRTLGRRY